MAAARGWTANAEAVQSFASDVLTVGDELAQAADSGAFAASLRELIELASNGRALAADNGDELVVTEARSFLLVVSR